MDLLDKMNRALNYIEDNLREKIDISQAAKLAYCSNFNFQRMFSFMADVSLAEYIRRRRLSMAAMDLLSTDTKILDVAIEYGYSSTASFSRAFQSVHGVNPSEVRNPGVKIKEYSRISFEITIKGVEAMNYRIEEFGQIRLIGWKEYMSMINGENFQRIPQFWQETYQSGKCEEMMKYNDNKNLGCLGVCANAGENGFDYLIATCSSKEIPDGMAELIIQPSKYVIFECVGKMPESIQNVWKRIFIEWFPAANYELVDGPQIEWYSDGDMASDSYKSEIWIPIRNKA